MKGKTISKLKPSTALSFVLAAGFVFFGVQKFGAENIVFETLAERSGLSIFEPGLRIFTGIAELVTALFLIVPKTRTTGALSGLGLLTGAIGLHLSPWLGINVPTIGHFLFITAVIMLFASLINFNLLRKDGGKILFIEKQGGNYA